MFNYLPRCRHTILTEAYINKLLCLLVENLANENLLFMAGFNNFMVVEILHRSLEHLQQLPTLVELPLTNDDIIVVGELNGQLADLVQILLHNGLPVDKHFVFLGNYTGYGPQKLQVLLLCLLLMLRWPNYVTLLRGFYETHEESLKTGFAVECANIFLNKKIYDIICQVFDWMPVAAVIQGNIFACHGGISQWMLSRESIRQLPRGTSIRNMRIVEACLLTDILYAAPFNQIRPFEPSATGTGYTFNRDAHKKVLDALNVDVLLRSSNSVTNGYRSDFNGSCGSICSSRPSTDPALMAAVIRISTEVDRLYIKAQLHMLHSSPSKLCAKLHRLLMDHNLQFPKSAAYLENDNTECHLCKADNPYNYEPRVITHAHITEWLMSVRRLEAQKLDHVTSGSERLSLTNLRHAYFFPTLLDIMFGFGRTFRLTMPQYEWDFIKKCLSQRKCQKVLLNAKKSPFYSKDFAQSSEHSECVEQGEKTSSIAFGMPTTLLGPDFGVFQI